MGIQRLIVDDPQMFSDRTRFPLPILSRRNDMRELR
jgi:hypothetical protein